MGGEGDLLILVAQQMCVLLFWSSWLEVEDGVGIYTPSQTSRFLAVAENLGADYPA